MSINIPQFGTEPNSAVQNLFYNTPEWDGIERLADFPWRDAYHDLLRQTLMPRVTWLNRDVYYNCQTDISVPLFAPSATLAVPGSPWGRFYHVEVYRLEDTVQIIKTVRSQGGIPVLSLTDRDHKIMTGEEKEADNITRETPVEVEEQVLAEALVEYLIRE